MKKNLFKIVVALFVSATVFVACEKDEVTPEPAKFAIDLSSKNFGEVQEKTSAEQVFVITNNGASDLELTAFMFDGDNKADFTTNGKKAIVAAGKTYTFKVTFIPESAGEKMATLKITTNVGEHNINLRGVGTSMPVPQFAITPESKDFGDVQVNSGVTPIHMFQITNRGNADLEITGFAISGDNSADFTTNGEANTLAAGKIYRFTVAFQPKTEGAKTATLKIATNAGEHTVALSGNATPDATKVYMAGAEKNSNGIWVATLWKDNKSNALGDGKKESKAFSVTVANNISYVVGYQISDNRKKQATLWKNGVATVLSDGTTDAEARTIAVVNGSVYVAGYEIKKNTEGVKKAMLWKDGVATVLSDGGTSAELFSIFIDGSDVYLAGYKTAPYTGMTIATLWKNGTASALTDGTAYSMAHSVYVANGNVYVAGHEYNSVPRAVATVWRNGVATQLFEGATQDGATSLSVFVANSNVYVAGMGNKAVMLWKNGTPTKLTDGAHSGYASSVFVANNDVYVAAYENNNQGNPVARLWKNGAAVFTNDKVSFANSVFVIE